MAEIICCNVYEEMKKAIGPIYMWGNGSMAKYVKDELKKNKIDIHSSFVGEVDAFLKDKSEKVNIVFGHGHYEKVKEICNLQGIYKIYLLPTPYPQYRMTKAELQYCDEYVREIKDFLSDEISFTMLQIFLDVHKENSLDLLLHASYLGDLFNFDKLDMDECNCYVDVGCYNGDTIDLLYKYTKPQKVIGIDPEKTFYDICKRKYETDASVVLYNCGVGNKNEKLFLDKTETQSAVLVESENANIDVRRLDELVDEKVDLIKISVPFLFLKILEGSEMLIKKWHPNLIINVGVDGTKIAETIKTIKSMDEKYDVYLRFDFLMSTRLYLYAIYERD